MVTRSDSQVSANRRCEGVCVECSCRCVIELKKICGEKIKFKKKPSFHMKATENINISKKYTYSFLELFLKNRGKLLSNTFDTSMMIFPIRKNTIKA